MTEHDNDELRDTAKRLFDESVERLDGATLSALTQRRYAALANTTQKSAMERAWLPATGVAAAAMFAAIIVQAPDPSGVSPPDDVTDFELLLSGDSLEMLEDLEFYSALDVIDSDDVG